MHALGTISERTAWACCVLVLFSGDQRRKIPSLSLTHSLGFLPLHSSSPLHNWVVIFGKVFERKFTQVQTTALWSAKFIRAKGSGKGSKEEANPVVWRVSPPRWLDQSGLNFQGLWRIVARTPSRKNFLKKLKNKQV